MDLIKAFEEEFPARTKKMNILFQKYHGDMDDKAIIEGLKTVTNILDPKEIVKGWKMTLE